MKHKKEMELHHIALSIEDPRDINGFYGHVLGMKEERNFVISRELAGRIFNIGRDTEVRLLKNHDLVLEIFIRPEKEDKNFHHVCISFQDREEVVRKALENGYRVTRISRDKSDLVFIMDSSGNLFEIKESTK